MKKPELSLDFSSLKTAYDSGGFTPADVVNLVYDRIEARGEDHVWIHLVPRAEALATAAALAARRESGDALPLFGLPFAVKDNVDVEGLPTTAACPDFEYKAELSSPVVTDLLRAGAILVGKTNLDQFATGLVGTRSPYGAPSSVFDPKVISGGSSSGSAVAVAAGLVSFALGTDTAGSGRVPAAFNNIVGWKPTRGLLSNRGMLPACRSLDCLAVFALTCGDVEDVMRVVARYDVQDPYSRRAPVGVGQSFLGGFTFGVPSPEQLEFFGDEGAATLFAQAVKRLESLGGRKVVFDYSSFRETADLLYSGPWVAERLAAVTPFFDRHPQSLHPVTAQIVSNGRRFSAVDTFQAFYRLEELRRRAEAEWTGMDVMLLPTTGTIYTHADLAAEPVKYNTNLGYYTNFVNLLDLCGVAVPAGFRPNGLPFGVTLLAPVFQDEAVCALSARYHAALGGLLGGTKASLPPLAPKKVSASGENRISLAVVGAHLSGQPLNGQLTRRRARIVSSQRTAPGYRLYALPDTVPPKPGLVYAPGFDGPGIEVEVWSLDEAAFGSFVSEVPPPLTIGTVTLDDGSTVKCFLCEPFAISGAQEITHFGGWRAYLGSQFAAGGVSPAHVVPLSSSPVRSFHA